MQIYCIFVKIKLTIMSPNELNPNEILEKLDAFYNNAWDKLIIYNTIFLTLIGIIVPFVIQWWQTRNLKIREEVLKSEINDLFLEKSRELEDTINRVIDERFNDEIAKTEKKLIIIKEKLQGSQFHLQANTSDDIKDRISSLIRAAECYVIAEEFLNLKSVIDMLNSNIPLITKEDIKDLNIEGVDFDSLIKKLLDMNNNEALLHSIWQMKKLVNKIPEKQV